MTLRTAQASWAPINKDKGKINNKRQVHYVIGCDVMVNLEVLHDRAVRIPRCLFCLSLVRCPEREVVAQELHDEGRVFVRLLGKRVELRNRIVERLRKTTGGDR